MYVGAAIAVCRRGCALACGTELELAYDVFGMGLNIEIPQDDRGELSVLGTCNIECILFAILERDLTDLMTISRTVSVIRC